MVFNNVTVKLLMSLMYLRYFGE